MRQRKLESVETEDSSATPGAFEALGRLTSAVAHEFKNLLLVISGLTDHVLNRSDLEGTTREDIERIRRAAEQADELTQRLVALGSRPPAPSRLVSPNALVGALERLLARLLGKEIRLSVDLGEGLGCVSADPDELEQCLLNLVLNARDALPEGGEIQIATGRIEIGRGTPGSLPPGRYLALRVSDDGVGMNEGTRARLFEPFFTTKEPGRGVGLGLSLVRSFVTRAGGEVHVRSGLGAGTTVELLLPELEVPAAGR